MLRFAFHILPNVCKKYGITVLSGTGNGKKLKHKKKE
jgi:hypothetical protein